MRDNDSSGDSARLSASSTTLDACRAPGQVWQSRKVACSCRPLTFPARINESAATTPARTPSVRDVSRIARAGVTVGCPWRCPPWMWSAGSSATEMRKPAVWVDRPVVAVRFGRSGGASRTPPWRRTALPWLAHASRFTEARATATDKACAAIGLSGVADDASE